MKRKGGLAKLTGNRSIIWRSKPRAVAALEALFSRKPVSLTAFENRPLREAVDNILARHSIDTIYVFSSQMAQYRAARPRQRVIMDFCDIDFGEVRRLCEDIHWPHSLVHEARSEVAAQP